MRFWWISRSYFLKHTRIIKSMIIRIYGFCQGSPFADEGIHSFGGGISYPSYHILVSQCNIRSKVHLFIEWSFHTSCKKRYSKNQEYIYYIFDCVNLFTILWHSFYAALDLENEINKYSYKRHFFQTDQFKFYHQYYILSTFPGACHSLWQFFFHRSYCPYLLSSILGSLNIWFAYSEMYFIRGNGFLNAAIMGLK